MNKIISGHKISQNLIKQIKYDLEKNFFNKNIVLKIVSVLVGEESSCKLYCEAQRNVCEQFGIKYELKKYNKKISQDNLIKEIKKLNFDKSVTGIIINLPLPGHINKTKVQNAILNTKDVEGVTSKNLGLLFSTDEKPVIIPSTALAVLECINSVVESIKGKEVVIVGHSEIVGKPIAMMLLNSKTSSATVTICHVGTRNLVSHTRRADILIVAVGKPNFIKGYMVKKGVIIIDVGINKVKNKIVGDVDFNDVIEKVGKITPVPGGVGVVTPIMLIRNLLNLHKVKS